MTQVSVLDALQTMEQAAEDMIEMVYEHQDAYPTYKEHYYDQLQGALETIIYILLYPMNPRLQMSERIMYAAENYLGQYDDSSIAIEYPDGVEMML
jgi:hypothetical protein